MLWQLVILQTSSLCSGSQQFSDAISCNHVLPLAVSLQILLSLPQCDCEWKFFDHSVENEHINYCSISQDLLTLDESVS